MNRKRVTTGIVIAVLIVSVVGVGMVTTGALAEESDNDDSRETATEMPTNSTETGALGADDVDWYAFDVEAGERIWVHLQLGLNDGTLKPNKSAHFDIIGPSGDEVNSYPDDMMGPAYSPNAGNTVEAIGGTMATESGTHYVRVEGTNITDYNLTVETQRLDEHDPNEQPATATPIESNETISAVMSGPDEDVYAIDLDKGETINVTTDTRSTTLVNAQVLAPNASDTIPRGFLNKYVVAWNYSNSFTHTANESGTYFVRITTEEASIGSFDEETSYELSATVAGADDDESQNNTDSETDDGTTETPDEDDSANEDDSARDDTETPTETEQPDADESTDDSDTTVDGTTDESSTTTDETEHSESEGTVDDTSEQSEC